MTRTDPKGIPAPDGFVIVFAIMAISALCTVGASAWQAQYPLPVIVARAEPPAESSKTPDRLPVIPVPTTAYRLDAPANVVLSQPVRSPWPCTLMRLAVEKFGREAVRRALRDSRHSKAEIDEAMACVVEKRT